MTGYRVVVAWIVVSLAAAACSHRRAWEHSTVSGLQADEKFDTDDKQCEAVSPDVLPPAVFQNAQYGYIYESYEGPQPGLSEVEAAHRARRLRGPTDDGITRSAAEPKTDLSRRAYGEQQRVYKSCMIGKGWRERPLFDGVFGGDAPPAGESQQPDAR